jgi:hypothetical protein
MVFQMFGLEWVMPKLVMDLLTCWNRRVGQNDINIVWNTTPYFFNVVHLKRKKRSKL